MWGGKWKKTSALRMNRFWRKFRLCAWKHMTFKITYVYWHSAHFSWKSCSLKLFSWSKPLSPTFLRSITGALAHVWSCQIRQKWLFLQSLWGAKTGERNTFFTLCCYTAHDSELKTCCFKNTFQKPLPWPAGVLHSNILALGNPMDRGARWATVCGVTKSWTRTESSKGHIQSPISHLPSEPCCVWNFLLITVTIKAML